MKIKNIIFSSFIAAVLVSQAVGETRVWSLKNGKSLEAEFVTIIGEKVSLKTLRGKVVKVPMANLSSEDISYMELINPPQLDLSLSKKSKVRKFPDSLSALPTSAYHDFKAVIQQTSTKPYGHELTAELFVIGREKIGEKLNTLLDYQISSFTLDKGSDSVYELSSNTVELMKFEMNGQLMGEEYAGFMIIVTDSRGEIIAQSSQRDEWLEIADNLRKLPVGKYFNDKGERCFSSPPKRWY